MNSKMANKKADQQGSFALYKHFVAICLVVLVMVITVALWQYLPEPLFSSDTEEFDASRRMVQIPFKFVAKEKRNARSVRIQKRLHQMYKDDSIPRVYVPFIEGWVKHHPQWEYWFWNDLDARRLIIDHYPQYLDMYDSYSNNLLRADASRYFILHHFGGVYADMDMDCFRPVDPLVFNYTCIFSQEPYIQSRLLYDRSSIAMNAWMACAAKHPFMSFAIEELPNFARPIKSIQDTIQITGPVMLQESLVRYKNRTRCEYPRSCHVYIAPPDMFMPTWDKGQKSNFLRKCRRTGKLSVQQVDACNALKAVKFANRIPADVYGNHRFLHIGYKNGYYRDAKSNIRDVVKKHIHRYSTIKDSPNCPCW